MSGKQIIEQLNELLEMSRLQVVSYSDGRVEDAVAILKEREVITETLKRDGVKLASGDDEARGIIDEIQANDNQMIVMITERKDATSSKLKKRLEAKKVITAYNEGIVTRS